MPSGILKLILKCYVVFLAATTNLGEEGAISAGARSRRRSSEQDEESEDEQVWGRGIRVIAHIPPSMAMSRYHSVKNRFNFLIY